MDDPLTIAGRFFQSRLLVGTGKFSSPQVMKEAIEASGADVVTVALRRVELENPQDSILAAIDTSRYLLLPNTSGARDAREAVRLARLARAAGCEAWVKLEVTPDPHYLLPDPVETLKAAEVLVKDGFVVLRTKDSIEIIIEMANVPVVVDAGLGAPSHAAEVMEMGADAVLVNTAIAVAGDPPAMARAFKKGVEAGREAFLAGLGRPQKMAEASSPLTGFLR